MITAQEARELAGYTLKEKVERLGEEIRKCAIEKKRQLRTGWDYKEDSSLWIEGGYSKTEEWRTAKKILEENGYKVSFYYRESQFVDMFTLIEW